MNEPATPNAPPQFDERFKAQLHDLFLWRRDVRRFQTTALPDGLARSLIDQALLAPSVGNSQPWRFILVDAPERRAAVRAHFEACNQDALSGYDGERAQTYAGLKLAGLDRAPVQLAVFCDEDTTVGHGLGSRTMPETLRYSVVAAVQTLWLAARAAGVGMGWVSILKPEVIHGLLDVPADWHLVAYLCLGYPEEEHTDPELVRAGWQDRIDADDLILKR